MNNEPEYPVERPLDSLAGEFNTDEMTLDGSPILPSQEIAPYKPFEQE